MNQLPQGLKAIMFDLGGVIIELHYQRTEELLRECSGKSMQQMEHLLVNADVLQRFEKGMIGEKEFRTEFSELLGVNLEDDNFDHIWNAMLGDIATSRVKALRQVPLQTMILSNTNSIHERAFNHIMEKTNGAESLHGLVDKVYFSHEVGMRKPDEEIYRMVLDDQKLRPEEILFIDDRQDNVDAANRLGIRTYQNRKINDWVALLSPLFTRLNLS